MINNDNIKINIPNNPKFILDTLEKNGFEAYIVGGCVRDQLLGKKASDFDITTNAKPEVVKSLFKRTIDTGIKHGTVTIVIKDHDTGDFLNYEVTTFRVEGAYKDGRHPENVEFVTDLYEDLSRRDFTINALAYNEKVGLVDRFDGLNDLNNKIIRAVGNPIDRYNEDALRILRSIRFAAKLSFDIEQNTLNAIKECKENLSKISKERIQIELTKTLISDNPDYIKYIFDYGLDKYITKSFSYIRYNKLIKTDDIVLAYSSLLYNNIDICYDVLKELKFDNDTIKNTEHILKHKNDFIKSISKQNDVDTKKYLFKKIIFDIGYDNIYKLLTLVSFKERIDLSDDLTIINDIKNNNEAVFISDLDIDGNDIISLGKSGKEVGDVLNRLLDEVHKNPMLNNKNSLLKMI